MVPTIPGSILGVPKFINQKSLIVDCTHLVLDSGKLVLQKKVEVRNFQHEKYLPVLRSKYFSLGQSKKNSVLLFPDIPCFFPAKDSLGNDLGEKSAADIGSCQLACKQTAACLIFSWGLGCWPKSASVGLYDNSPVTIGFKLCEGKFDA